MRADIIRLNRQIDRLLRILEEKSQILEITRLPASTNSDDSRALTEIVWESYRALLADQEWVPEEELRAEVLECWRDLHGVEADCAIELSDILNDPELRVKMRLDGA